MQEAVAFAEKAQSLTTNLRKLHLLRDMMTTLPEDQPQQDQPVPKNTSALPETLQPYGR